jgi:hypothetical protein
MPCRALACAVAKEAGVRVKTFFLLIGLLFLGEILAIALPGHHRPAGPTEVAELNVTIREWPVPTKGAHPHVARMARCGSPNKW